MLQFAQGPGRSLLVAKPGLRCKYFIYLASVLSLCLFMECVNVLLCFGSTGPMVPTWAPHSDVTWCDIEAISMERQLTST